MQLIVATTFCPQRQRAGHALRSDQFSLNVLEGNTSGKRVKKLHPVSQH